MRIAILAHNLRVAGGLSVGKNIVAILPKVAPQHEYFMIIPSELGYETHGEKENVSVIEIEQMSFLKRIFFDLLVLPKLVKKFNPDVIFGLGNLGIINPPCKQAILVQKSNLMYSAKHYKRELYKYRLKNLLLKQRIKKILRYTQLVFCQTPVVKEKFAHVFKYPSNQIKIMPNAVSEFSRKQNGNKKVPEIFNNKNFNLFFLTKFYAHKNLEILIEIFKKYSEKLKDIRCIITISADQHPNAPKFLGKIEKYKLDNHIINAGPLKQEELACYFNASDALFFPTLLESFSGTYLEAMHFGLPIMTSNLDFARYICDDAAVYFDPWNPEDIVEKILLLKNNPQLREELVEKGTKRASKFFKSWEEILKETVKELELLVNKN